MTNNLEPITSRRKSLTTVMAALLAGSIAMTAGVAEARSDGQAFDPGAFQQRIEKRVGKALNATDATAEQKKKVTDILQTAFKDMKPLNEKRVEARKALVAAMEAPTIDPARIEAIRAEQMKAADEASRRFTRALTDAGNVLSAAQRQAFFKSWGDHWAKRG